MAAAALLRNVLWFQADDLRPNLGFLQPFMQTPHIDRLASRGIYFQRAYVQQQVCSPSRNSYMTGRRPDRTRVWNFIDDFRVRRDTQHPGSEGAGPGNGASWFTLPGYFKAHGYQVFGSGKTFHTDRPINNDLAHSWTSYDDVIPGDRNHSCDGGSPRLESCGTWGCNEIVACEENDSEVLLTRAAITHIRWATSPENVSKPFFVAMGHHKPHLPWTAPTQFFEKYGGLSNASGFPLAKVDAWPSTAPDVSWHPWFDQTYWNTRASEAHRKRLAYYSAVSYFGTPESNCRPARPLLQREMTCILLSTSLQTTTLEKYWTPLRLVGQQTAQWSC